MIFCHVLLFLTKLLFKKTFAFSENKSFRKSAPTIFWFPSLLHQWWVHEKRSISAKNFCNDLSTRNRGWGGANTNQVSVSVSRPQALWGHSNSSFSLKRFANNDKRVLRIRLWTKGRYRSVQLFKGGRVTWFPISWLWSSGFQSIFNIYCLHPPLMGFYKRKRGRQQFRWLRI